MDALDARVRASLEANRTDDGVSDVIRSLGPEMMRFFLATARDEDAASDAFGIWSERVWKALPRFRWDCGLRPWLYVIARAAFLDVARSAGRRAKKRAPVDGISQVAARVRTETLSLYRAENVDAIARLRAALPDDDRLLLVLRVDRELAWNDIAAVFLRTDETPSPTAAALTREAARLRKRFQLVKERLYEMAKGEGLLPSP